MRLITFVTLSFISLCLFTCIDSYEPAFDEIERLIIIQGQVTDYPGDTRISISESVLFLRQYTSRQISDAMVSIRREDGVKTILEASTMEPGIYLPPSHFQAQTGSSYRLTVELPDGNQYESTVETIPEGIAIESLTTLFDPQYSYSELRNEFLPAHRIMATWQDPADEVNQYQWRFTVYREESICISCDGGIYRGGDTCIIRDNLPISNRYDYLCSEPCWSIDPKYPISTFSDAFMDGSTISNQEVADVLYESRKDVLVTVHQYSISSEHYRFNKLISELVVESGGLNAVSPGAIVGNIINSNDPDEKVLGYFGASARTDKSIYIKRTAIVEQPTGGIVANEEPPSPFETIPRSPCQEGPFRTKTKPEGWP